MTTEKELQEYVNNGAKLLDKKCPGWFLKIDLKKLDLADCFNCVLGQLFGDYAEGKIQLFNNIQTTKATKQSRECGFTSSFSDFTQNTKNLSQLWRNKINEKLKNQKKYRVGVCGRRVILSNKQLIDLQKRINKLLDKNESAS